MVAKEQKHDAPHAAESLTETFPPYMQNRELSWLSFDERVLDQGTDENVPLLERLNFISIFWSNMQEFFMVRVGSLTDLSLLNKHIVDDKCGMTPKEQLDAIYARCQELYPLQEQAFNQVNNSLREKGVNYVPFNQLTDDQKAFLHDYMEANISPFLAPQIINSRHPFPHLENGALYVIVRLDELTTESEPAPTDKKKKKKQKGGAEGVTLGLIPLPRQCKRVITLPGEGFCYTLLEQAIELYAPEVFDMYAVKNTNVICVTRNADLDTAEGNDEDASDYREHMKRILKRRGRLSPVRLESAAPLTDALRKYLLDRLGLQKHQLFSTTVPLDLSYTWGLSSYVPEPLRSQLVNVPFAPEWPAVFDKKTRILDQVSQREVLMSYPYESMDAFVQMLREASEDPSVISIRITLYRLATVSRLAEALIAAAENGKQVDALFELRARFDESNNIVWSQRFEEAGCNVIYGFRDYKVHSKICCITRQTENGLQYITQLGTGNYNEKTARLYTDFSFITTDKRIGEDATEFFRNMALENASDEYETLWVAPLQIKQRILDGIDEQIANAQAGKPSGLFFKTNSVTDHEIIVKIAEASQAGVPCTLFVRGICCLVPGIKGYTENVRVVSIVGRLLEHSRIYAFGPEGSPDMRVYLSSADLMTRNMEKRVEIAWPLLNPILRHQVVEYISACMRDTAKLRELKSDGTYTPLGYFAQKNADGEVVLFDSQAYHIEQAKKHESWAAAVSEVAPAVVEEAPAEDATADAAADTPEHAPAEVENVAPANQPAQEAKKPDAQTKRAFTGSPAGKRYGRAPQKPKWINTSTKALADRKEAASTAIQTAADTAKKAEVPLRAIAQQAASVAKRGGNAAAYLFNRVRKR